MKVLKSMMCVVTLMLLLAIPQSNTAAPVATDEVATCSFDIGIIDILQRIGTVDTFPRQVETPLSPLHFPVKVQALDKEGNVIFTKRGGTSFVLPANAAKLVVSQAGKIVVLEDVPS